MENVMMNSIRTQIKIVDFGLSNTYHPNSPLHTHCGSPEYAAPELFVPSKCYGPEVDLWSLGVILFGMVAGQLPFIVVHEENVSSQERRKKLLVQINKGYCNVQRKILSLVSAEFRSVVSRMLVADALKRISLQEVLTHAWVTDKGRKAVIVNPFEPLDDEWSTSVMKKVSNMLQIEWRTVKYAVNSEPYGDIAATYNILVHKLHSDRLNGDGITKTFFPPLYSCASPIVHDTTHVKTAEKNNAKKRAERVKSPSVHKLQRISRENLPLNSVSPPLPSEKRPQTSIGGYNLRKNKGSPGIEQHQMLTADARNRMEIESDLKYTMRHWLCLTERVHKIIPKNQLNTSNVQRASPNSASKKNVTCSPRSHSSSKDDDEHAVGSKGNSKMMKKISNQENRDVMYGNNLQMGNVTPMRGRNKSSTRTVNKRSVSSSMTTKQGSRVIAVMGTSSDPKPSSPLVGQKIQQIRSRRVVTSKPAPNVERYQYDEGNKCKQRPYSTDSSKQSTYHRNVLTDPIARSIAGYLSKNMPNNVCSRTPKKHTVNTPPAYI